MIRLLRYTKYGSIQIHNRKLNVRQTFRLIKQFRNPSIPIAGADIAIRIMEFYGKDIEMDYV